MPGGLAEQGHVEQVGFVGVGDGGLRRRDLGRNEMGFHRVGMNAVIELGQGAGEVPGKGKAAVFVVLKPLEFLDQIELELRAEPRTELESDVCVRIRAAITSGAGNHAFGAGPVNPGFGGQEKAVPACLISNSLEFEGIKTRVVYLFPDAEEEDGVLVLEPLLNERTATLEIPYHVGERDVVAMFPGQDGDGCALDFDGGFLRFAHGVSVVAGM